MKNLYENRDPRNRIEDGEPRALYWHTYRSTYKKWRDQLEPGKPVPDETPICMIGNNQLRAESFDLRKRDREPAGACEYPGKSAHVTFTENPHEACGGIMDRDARRQDRLYLLNQAGELKPLGYRAYYAPTPNQPLHIRLVHECHIEDPSVRQPPFRARKALAELFSQQKIKRVRQD